MKISLFCMMLIAGTVSHAALKSPKTMVFYSEAGVKTVVSFDSVIVLNDEKPTTPAAPGEPTHTCDIYYNNPEDNEMRVNGHRKVFSSVRVSINNKKYRITPAYGAGTSNMFGEKWERVTTLVYKNSADCHAKKNPVRVQIGLFESLVPVYTNQVDYNVGWESDSDKAVFFTGLHNEGPRVTMRGTVLEWY